MAIHLSNSTVAANAPAGTIVGTLSESRGTAKFSIWAGSGEFAILGSNLVTAWSGTISPGNYSVFVFARVSAFIPFDIAVFQITVAPVAKATIGLDMKNVALSHQSTPTKPGP